MACVDFGYGQESESIDMIYVRPVLLLICWLYVLTPSHPGIVNGIV